MTKRRTATSSSSSSFVPGKANNSIIIGSVVDHEDTNNDNVPLIQQQQQQQQSSGKTDSMHSMYPFYPMTMISSFFSTIACGCRYRRQRHAFTSIAIVLMLLLLLLHTETSEKKSSLKSSPSIPANLELMQLQVIHRHGDRSPITPMSDVTYWKSQLPTDDELQSLEEQNPNVVLIRDGKEVAKHSAAGDDTFGRLTSLGIHQMVRLGQSLRHDVSSFTNHKDISTDMLHVASTDFPRTILSAKALLHGFFLHDSQSNQTIPFDLRYTNKMIPDPQPRLYKHQLDIESSITQSDLFKQKEQEMYPLAVHVSNVLYQHHLVDLEKASQLSFGVGEDQNNSQDKKDDTPAAAYPVLSWGQLAEITHCLLARNLLPTEISLQDQENIMNYLTWRWFQLLSHDELRKIALKSLIKKLIWNASAFVDTTTKTDKEPILLHLFSAHDATLIGVICGLQMKQPSSWPGYGSFLKIELLKEKNIFPTNPTLRNFERNREEGMEIKQKYYLRFSLNNEILSSTFGSVGGGSKEGVYRELIPLDEAKDALVKLEQSVLEM